MVRNDIGWKFSFIFVCFFLFCFFGVFFLLLFFFVVFLFGSSHPPEITEFPAENFMDGNDQEESRSFATDLMN